MKLLYHAMAIDKHIAMQELSNAKITVLYIVNRHLLHLNSRLSDVTETEMSRIKLMVLSESAAPEPKAALTMVPSAAPSNLTLRKSNALMVSKRDSACRMTKNAILTTM